MTAEPDVLLHDATDTVVLEPRTARARAWLRWFLRGFRTWGGTTLCAPQQLPDIIQEMERSKLRVSEAWD